MYRSALNIFVVSIILSGCAERVININDNDGNVIGECNAGFDWHLYGLQDSIDYMMYECAKESIGKGHTISDERLLTLDFTLPEPPTGKEWDKKLAMHHFHQGNITERKLGYILAAIEYDYIKVVWVAEDDLANGLISEAEFDKILKQAKRKWLGE